MHIDPAGSRLRKDHATIYAIIGDGESQEGTIWEAAMSSAHYQLDNLIAFTDYNHCQIDGTVEDVAGMSRLEENGMLSVGLRCLLMVIMSWP